MDEAALWTLAGVFVGFSLGEGSRYVRHRVRIGRLKRVLYSELESIKAQIPFMRDICEQIIRSLDQREILPGLAVPTINEGYRSVIGEIYEYLTLLERNCLHIIYGRLKAGEGFLTSFERQLIDVVRDNTIVSPFDVFADQVNEIRKSYDYVEELIESYLQRTPIDVFEVKVK